MQSFLFHRGVKKIVAQSGDEVFQKFTILIFLGFI